MPASNGEAEKTALQTATSILATTGAFLSFTTTFTLLLVLGTTICLGHRARYPFHRTSHRPRTILILSIFLADFVNSVNNFTSLMYSSLVGPLEPTSACKVNGMVGQYSVQASDLSTFAIAVYTFIVLRLRRPVKIGGGGAEGRVGGGGLRSLLAKKTRVAVGLTLAVWCLPLVSTTVGYFWLGYAPAGQWCWFPAEPKPRATIVRYTLTHGPRILIIMAILLVYSYLYLSFRITYSRTQRALHSHQPTSTPTPALTPPPCSTHSSSSNLLQHRTRRAIRKLALYPAVYIILWMPGMLNRLFEAVGSSSKVLVLLQASTQFMGLANASVYGYTEDVRGKIKAMVIRRRSLRRSRFKDPWPS